VRVIPYSPIRGFVAVVAGSLLLAACSSRAVMPPSSSVYANSSAARAHSISRDANSIEPHVLTWDALGSGGIQTTVTDAQAAVYLTWVMSSISDSVGFHAAGIKTMYYTQPNRQAPGSPEYSTDETTFAHDCSNNRIFDTTFKTENLMDPTSTHLGQLWQAEAQNVTGHLGGQFDAIYEDLTDTIIYTTTQPCGFDQTAWSAASNSLTSYISSMGLPVIYNGLGAFGPWQHGIQQVSPTIAMNQSTIGGMDEGCYNHNGRFEEIFAPQWFTVENTEIQMTQAQKLFFCRNLDTTFANNAINSRLYAYASFLMTYGPHTSAYGSSLSTFDGFHELPEVQLVALKAVQPLPSDISGLKQTGGTYGRQFGSCYVASVLVGPCAVVVNPQKWSLNFPWPTLYHHTLTVSGQDIYGGGTMSTTGPPPPASVPETTGIIAFQ
jgi:hypothetical protein